MQFGEQLWCDERPEFRSHKRAECKFFLIGFIRIVEFRKLDDGNSKQLAEYKPSMGWAAPLGLHVLFRKRIVLGHYLARSCPNALSQFSMW